MKNGFLTKLKLNETINFRVVILSIKDVHAILDVISN